MKLIRFGEPGREKPGVLLRDGARLDASGFGSDYDEAFFESDGLAALQHWVERNGSGAPHVPASDRWGPPIRRPSKIVCIGLNYRDHAAETGAELPKEPVLFFKSTTSLVGPNDAVIIPRGATKLDWEVEIAVIVGRRASYITREHAFDYVAGYALHNDYSERSFQLERGGQWVKGKSAPTFGPLGPWLVTPDEIENVQALNMWLDVSGERMQTGSTATMVFGVKTLVSYISQFIALEPGDVITTGTPPGVGSGKKPPRFLKAGDTMSLGIDGLGQQAQRVVAWKAD